MAILEQVLPTPPTINALIIGYAPPINTYATIKSMAKDYMLLFRYL